MTLLTSCFRQCKTFTQITACAFFTLITTAAQAVPAKLALNDLEYFEDRGVNVLVFSNWYNGLFSDSKMSGIEFIHHGVRTATNGDVRLNATPEQWDEIPEFVRRTVDAKNQTIEAFLRYPDYKFEFSIKAHVQTDKLMISVHLPKVLPKNLQGKAGFNLEFLPASYFEKAFLMDGQGGTFPLYPTGPKEVNDKTAPQPLAEGHQLTLAPEDPTRRVTIHSPSTPLALYDGRNKAQNGWYVVRSVLPSNQKGKVLEWQLSINKQDNWMRPPMIAHSQVGYFPKQQKIAVIELDKHDTSRPKASLERIEASGEVSAVLSAQPQEWGMYKRYRYLQFDFSTVTQPGLYQLRYADQTTTPFRIDQKVLSNAWHPTLDVYLPVQMDHMLINEAYRVWHGASHLDDALQAPVNHEHFDLYAQGPTTDTPYKPLEHIPGLNIGGWYDAGDYDIRTQTQYGTVLNLINTWEEFKPLRDNTTVDYPARYVDLHVPDGKPDILQQIEHGTLALIAQHRAVGRAINGIIVPEITQYTHLGDGLTMTDNLIYDASLKPLESDGVRSGVRDDRWAFTSRSSAVNYGSIAALAAASRALKGYNDELAKECLERALAAWKDEQSHGPFLFQHGNTTGGPLPREQLNAAVELLITTGDSTYADKIQSLLPEIEKRFIMNAASAVRVLPLMPKEFGKKIEQFAMQHQAQLANMAKQNPFGVYIGEGGWAGNGGVIFGSLVHYYLNKAFPNIIGTNDVLRGLNYLYGTHPDSNISLVSAVGTRSKKVAYGMNRADYSFIAGGIVPGILMLKPDFPENKEDWPFLWGENEYVVDLAASYIFIVHAAEKLLIEQEKTPRK